ncbi:MAG: hypothetical protein WA476_20155 [Acidobacteriaceae bacterium]
MDDEVWVGMTEVSKGQGCELDFHGVAAFVWWATQADSEESFLRKLKNALEYYKLVLLDLKEIRRFQDTDDVSEEFVEMVERARKNEDWVLFGTFHTYPHHQA